MSGTLHADAYRPCPDGCGGWDHLTAPDASGDCRRCGLAAADCTRLRADHLDGASS